MNILPEPTLMLHADDLVSVVGFPEVLSKFNVPDSGEVRNDRRHFDYMRVFVSKPGFIGMRLGNLPMPEGVSAKII
jgi:uncharacterized transporter YbjL